MARSRGAFVSFSRGAIALAALFTGITVAAADGVQNSGQLRWKSGATPTLRIEPAAAVDTVEWVLANGQAHFVLQLDRPVTDADRAALDHSGVTLLAYLSDNAFFAAVDARRFDRASFAATGGLFDVRPIEREWKLHPLFVAGEIPAWAVVDDDKGPSADPDVVLPVKEDAAAPSSNPVIGAYVVFHADVPRDAAANVAMRYGARVRQSIGSLNALVVELPYVAVHRLADEDAVQWIEPPLPRMSEVNAENRALTGADVAQAPPYSLSGTGVTALVYDGGSALASHPDLTGRLTVIDNASLSNHSTHVSGTVAGNGAASSGTNRGMAPGASVVSAGFQYDGSGIFLYTNPGDIEADYGNAINNFGADIANNSIGTNTETNGFDCAIQGNYGLTDSIIDAIVRGSVSGGTPFRIVWAGGNERQGSRCDVEGYGDYYSTAPPAGAKNHVCVGALNANDDSMTSFSSWGPVDDGRLKPDITAPGCQVGGDEGITSCSSSGGYTVFCGTSMASPTVCGLGALLLEDFRAHFPGAPDFRNSTLKAILAHTAVDLGNPGPDFQFGYGSVRIQPAIELMRAANFLEASLSQGETFNAVVIVAPTDTQLKVTLTWDDPPGTPNVNPALVNDLDLRVFDAANNQYFPWTLDHLNPSANAVRTQADSKNNIEQVVIDAPAPGGYRLVVAGTNVPQGPQPFSIAVSPLLVNCSSQGTITLDRVKYACASSATVRVVDCDLNLDDGVVETVNIAIASTSEPAGEVMTLTETAAESATFLGTITLSTTDSAGILWIADGDTVTATYIDADDGQGGQNVVVLATAPVDCSPPIISNVAVSNVGPRSATITFDTDEPANGNVNFGDACGNLPGDGPETGFHTSHSIELTGLNDNSTYFFTLDAADQAGNAATNDNGGACFTFATPEVPDFFTESFDGGDNDLDNVSITFVPDGGVDRYTACVVPISALPTDPAGGTTLVMTDEDSELVNLTGGAQVILYGVSHNSVYIGSNGYVTFVSDTDYTETLDEHFSNERIAALYDDLSPNQAGSVSYKQLSDRFVATWLNVTEYNAANQNTFQIELFFDGRIAISYLSVAATDGIVGLSDGTGLSPDFFETDLSALGDCGPRPPSAAGANIATPQDTQVNITLQASDDGTPGPLSYIITALPTYELRDAADDHVITSGELPYTLLANGNQVKYHPTGGYNGPDSFQFKANDGGSPPDGGDSNIATINITVEPVIELPFVDTFPSTTFDSAKWKVADATIDNLGISPPSAPNSARFNGSPDGGDEVYTHLINLAGQAAVRLTYYYEQRGGGESPDAGDDLFVEFLDAQGGWQLLSQHLGSGPDMNTFAQVEIVLPAEAYHAAFRLRFRNTATVGAFDDWFVDDVSLVPVNAPTAFDGQVTLPANGQADVTLNATDPNGDPLTYVIQSLPSHGALSDPNGGNIDAVPYSLLAGGNVVHYEPQTGYQGADAFTFLATDGTYDSNVATISITIGGPQVIYDFPLDTDPGWAVEGQWAWGDPTGGGSHGLDPQDGFTGANVLGYNLNGDYANNLTVRYLTTTPLDLTGVTQTELRFRRWLGVESSTFDHADIQASNDGVNWVTVWEHAGASFSETSWSLQTYSLAAVADNQPAVRLRWGMGPTDASVTYPGWNLDDIQVWGLVSTTCEPCDTNCDGSINGQDIQPFIQILNGAAGCSPCAGDTNADGSLNGFDITPFVDCLNNP